MTIELPKSAYIRDLKKVVAERMNVDPITVSPTLFQILLTL
jgi:hypothetical protein